MAVIDFSPFIPSRYAKAKTRVRISVERMNALIDALLEMARIVHGELDRKPVAQSAIVHLITAELQQSNLTRQVEFVISEGITTNGDDPMLRIVLETC